VQEGDILVSWSATLDVFIWDGPEAVLNQHIFKVNVSDNINPHFFYYLLSDSIDLLQMRVQGSTMRHITKSTFENTQVPLPPKSEQSRIAEILSTVDDTIPKDQQIKTKLEALKRGLMQDLLTGKVRVPVET
jgi:type I restriction enzyme S subunit